MKTIFDFGMYDTSDTNYYLEEGFKVVAVEANPALVRRAEKLLAKYIESGQLQIVHAAIAPNNDPIELTVCGDDLGSSSIYKELVETRTPVGKFTVAGITTQELFTRFGVPYYLKVDLEGADRLCVEALTATSKPEFFSFEIGDDFERLFEHLTAVGFTRFKIIDQCYFRELANQNNFFDRAARKIMRTLGYIEPTYARRGGRYFGLGRSSGPVPWKSDGKWCSANELLIKWEKAKNAKQGNLWYDLHAGQ